MKMLLLIALAVGLGIGGLIAVSANAKHASTLLSQIQTTDAASQDPAPGITELKTYAAGHMGAGKTFTLTAAYNRAVAAAQAANQSETANSQIYAAAQAACAGKTDSITQAKCNQQYLSTHLAAVPTTALVAPKVADYKYSVKSPVWTPDTAGWFLGGALAAIVGAGLVLVRGRR